MGLDGNLYGTVRSSLLAIEPLPSLNRVYSTEERVKNMAWTREDHGEFMALATQSTFKQKAQGENRDKRTVCSHCKQSGHEASECFQLVGYPDWSGDRPCDTRLAE